MSNNVSTKALAFALEQSSTVTASGPLQRPEILPRRPQRRVGLRWCGAVGAANPTEDLDAKVREKAP